MSLVIFTLLRLAPGDIVDILFSTAGYVSPSEKQAIMKELGIDRPYWVQYLDWLRQIASGDLGKSYRYDLPAWQIIRPLLPVTLELAALSMVFAVALGAARGAARGLHPHRVGEGPGRARGHLAPRPQERDAAGDHRDRDRVRLPHRRPGRHRAGVQPPRGRPLPRGRDPLARLPDRAEPGHVHRDRRDPGEPPRGHALRRAGPARALWQLATAMSCASDSGPCLMAVSPVELAVGADVRLRPGAWTTLARFFRKKPLGAAGGVLMLAMALTAVFAEVLQTHDPIATDAAYTL